MNIINLIILEIGEWRYLTSESVKHIISKESYETLVLYGNFYLLLLALHFMTISYIVVYILCYHRSKIN